MVEEEESLEYRKVIRNRLRQTKFRRPDLQAEASSLGLAMFAAIVDVLQKDHTELLPAAEGKRTRRRQRSTSTCTMCRECGYGEITRPEQGIGHRSLI